MLHNLLTHLPVFGTLVMAALLTGPLDVGKPEPVPIIPTEDSFDDWAFGGKAG